MPENKAENESTVARQPERTKVVLCEESEAEEDGDDDHEGGGEEIQHVVEQIGHDPLNNEHKK